MNALQLPHLSESPFLERSTWPTLGELTQAVKDNTTLRGSRSDAAKFLTDLNVILWRVIPPVLLLLGTFGNVMTVLVMRGMRPSPSTACLSIYFTALAVSDQCSLMVSLMFYWVHLGFTWPPSFFRFNILCFVPKTTWIMAGFMSAWFLVAMTYQRVTSVVAPHRVGVLCTARRGKIIVAIIMFISFALHFHFLFTWVYYPEYGSCYYREKYIYLVDYFEWQELLGYATLPFVFLVVGNSVLIWHVIKSLQISRTLNGGAQQQVATSRKDHVHSMSLTLIVTSTAYLVLTLPDCIIDVLTKTIVISDDYHGAVIGLVETCCAFGWVSSTASNFYLYLLSGSKFRHEAKRYLCCRKSDHLT